MYLFIYNLFQFVGFTFISCILIVNFLRNKEGKLYLYIVY